MGCGPSWKQGFDLMYDEPWFESWKAQFDCLQIKKSEMKSIFRIFHNISGGGLTTANVGLEELFYHIHVERTVFTERVFSIFDEDGSNEIDFREFTIALWNFCTLSGHTLETFVFELYDDDHSGSLSASEVLVMLTDIYGSAIDVSAAAGNLISDLKDQQYRGIAFDLGRFRRYTHSHQAMLFPVFQLQLALREHILGPGFWTKNMRRRKELTFDKFCPIQEFLEGEMLQRGWCIITTKGPDGKDQKEFVREGDMLKNDQGRKYTAGSTTSTNTAGSGAVRPHIRGELGSPSTEDEKVVPWKEKQKGTGAGQPNLTPEQQLYEDWMDLKERNDPRPTSQKRYPKRGSISGASSNAAAAAANEDNLAGESSRGSSPQRTPRRSSLVTVGVNGELAKESKKSPRRGSISPRHDSIAVPTASDRQDIIKESRKSPPRRGSISPRQDDADNIKESRKSPPRRGSISPRQDDADNIKESRKSPRPNGDLRESDGGSDSHGASRSPRRTSIAMGIVSDALASQRESKKTGTSGTTSPQRSPRRGSVAAEAAGSGAASARESKKSPRRGSSAEVDVLAQVRENRKSPRRGSVDSSGSISPQRSPRRGSVGAPTRSTNDLKALKEVEVEVEHDEKLKKAKKNCGEGLKVGATDSSLLQYGAKFGLEEVDNNVVEYIRKQTKKTVKKADLMEQEETEAKTSNSKVDDVDFVKSAYQHNLNKL